VWGGDQVNDVSATPRLRGIAYLPFFRIPGCETVPAPAPARSLVRAKKLALLSGRKSAFPPPPASNIPQINTFFYACSQSGKKRRNRTLYGVLFREDIDKP